MKIGIDGRLWNETGVGRYIRNLVLELSILDQKNDYVLFLQTKDKERVKITNPKFKLVVADIKWHTVEEQVRFPKILNKENLDLMHFPYFSVPVMYKKPFVITIHDLIINHFSTGKASTLPMNLYQLKRLGYKYIVSRAVNRAKKIIVPLNAVKEDLIKTLDVAPDKITVTYEGFDLGINSKVKSQKSKIQIKNQKYFLYVGNAYPHKNLERLIKAFSLFRKEHSSDVRLLLVGKNDFFYTKLEEKVVKENYTGITFVHNANDSDLAYLYQNAEFFVSVSLMEGFGLPSLEAMSLGCPVLVSNIPSFREVCKDAAVYADPLSVEDIKSKMVYLWEREESIKKGIIQTGEKRAKVFSWKKMGEETLEVYESCSSASSE